MSQRDGVTLACLDFEGDGPPVLLLHGLAGGAAEWSHTARWLTRLHRVVAPDQRGHGSSERRPANLSRAAYVADAEMWLQRLSATPAIVIGQSLGGHTAFLLAARRPDLMRGLVVVEATPEADADASERVRRWLHSWPLPFTSRAAALRFFGGRGLWARTWADGLEARDDGLWPRFDADIMVESLAEVTHRAFWDEWLPSPALRWSCAPREALRYVQQPR